MRGRGIFAMIDDECFIPRGSDANLAQRMYASLTVNPCFQVTEVLKRQGEFIVHHYAGDVVYSTKGFVEKNKNELPREVRIFSESSNALLSILFDAVETDSSSGSARTSISSPEPRKSVSMQQVQVPVPRGSIRGDSPAPRNSISMDSPYIRRSRTVGGQFKEQLLSLMDKIQVYLQ
jgi:myosin-5